MMTHELRFLVVGAAMLALGALAQPAAAQGGNPFLPPTSAMDELSGMSTGPSPGAYMPQPPAAPPWGPEGDQVYAVTEPYAPGTYQQPYAPFGAEGAYASPYGGVEGGYPPYGAPQVGFGVQQPTIPVVPRVTVVRGERFFDNFTRELIEEAVVDEVPETEVEGLYFDDGSHGDALSGDEVYTNVTENYDHVGQLTHKLRRSYVGLLLAAEDIEPLEFFRLLAVTSDPLSTVNQELEEEEERDERIRAWNMRFLAFARQNPTDEKSSFHPLHVPRPPLMPKSPLPQGYDPRPPKPEEQQPGYGGTPGALAAEYWMDERGGAGAPRGAASSRYF